MACNFFKAILTASALLTLVMAFIIWNPFHRNTVGRPDEVELVRIGVDIISTMSESGLTNVETIPEANISVEYFVSQTRRGYSEEVRREITHYNLSYVMMEFDYDAQIGNNGIRKIVSDIVGNEGIIRGNINVVKSKGYGSY